MSNHQSSTVEPPDLAQELADHAKVCAARTRLQNAAGREDALEAIREIAANLIGTEEVAVFRFAVKRWAFWLDWSFGIDPHSKPVLEVSREPWLQEVLAGKPVFQSDHGKEELLSGDRSASALVPIVIDGSTSAVIVLFRLFPHKPGIEPVDREICEVLSHCSSRAIEPSPE